VAVVLAGCAVYGQSSGHWLESMLLLLWTGLAVAVALRERREGRTGRLKIKGKKKIE
jgi:hypothetical protein